MSAFAAVVLDMDSTIVSVEGIDWLAKLRDARVAREIEALTARAMDGTIELDSVYGERLALIRPDAREVAELANVYEESLAPGAREVVVEMRAAGIRLAIVSGGIREAILPAARSLGLADCDVHAVAIRFDAEGAYTGFDATSPLITQNGKAAVVSALALPRPTLAVGDGSTDAAMKPAVDAFAAYTEFVRRDAVVAAAQHELRSFYDLREMVLA